MKYLILILLIAILAINVFAGDFLIEYQKQVDGLGVYHYIDPIINNNGTFVGFIGTNAVTDTLDVYDADGNLTLSIGTTYNPEKTVNRYSDNNDTLYIYLLMEDPYAFDGWGDHFSIDLIAIYNDAFSVINTVFPDCYEMTFPVGMWNSLSEGIQKRNIWVEYDPDEQMESFYFYTRQHFHVDHTTSFTEEEIDPTFKKYSLDLNVELYSAQKDFAVWDNFDNDTTVGYAACRDYFLLWYYDWWDENRYEYTNFVFTPNDSTVFYRETDGSTAHSYALFTGDFIKSVGNHEIIYYGNAMDLLGIHEGINSHMACYGVEYDTVSEEWYTPMSSFSPMKYNPSDNALIGARGSQWIMFLDCSNGQWRDSVLMSYNLKFKYFYIDSEYSRPHLFGMYDDTLFVYGFNSSTDVPESENQNLIPNKFALSQNFPNPFNPSTTIEYTLQSRSNVTITVFDILGRKVKTIFDQTMPVGTHTAYWDGTNVENNPVATGVYFYQIKAGDFVETKKMLLLK